MLTLEESYPYLIYFISLGYISVTVMSMWWYYMLIFKFCTYFISTFFINYILIKITNKLPTKYFINWLFYTRIAINIYVNHGYPSYTINHFHKQNTYNLTIFSRSIMSVQTWGAWLCVVSVQFDLFYTLHQSIIKYKSAYLIANLKRCYLVNWFSV